MIQKLNIFFSTVACLLLAGLIALVLMTGAAFKKEAAAQPVEEGEGRVLTVDTVAAASDASFQINRTYSGLTRAANSIDLSFPRAGKLDRFHVEVGDAVKEGELLAELDKRRLELQRRQINDALKKPSTPENPPTVTQVDADLVELDLEDSMLEAPFDGVISMRQASVGSTVSPGAPVLKIVQREGLEAWVGVPVDVVEEMKVGETHSLTIGSEEVSAPISAILPEVDSSARTRTVVFDLDEKASSEILPGSVVRLTLNRDVESDGLWLPLSALTRESRGLWSVFVADPDQGEGRKISRAYVEIVHLEADRARVRGTFGENAQIVSAGTHRIVPGQKVTIQGEEGGSGENPEETEVEPEEEEAQ